MCVLGDKGIKNIMDKITKIIPNCITSSRIVLAILLIFTKPFTKAFFWLYSMAALTDMVDGFLARKLDAVSKLGSILDSIGDLLLFTIMMIKMFPSLMEHLPKYCWVAIYSILALRILMYAYMGLFRHKFMSSHNLMNKATGLSIFFVPYCINTSFFVPYATAVCAIALIAALWDLKLIISDKGWKKNEKA